MKSARDKGTLYQLRTVLDRRNVVADPHKDFNSCHDFLDTVVDGHLVAAICQIFGMKSPDDITDDLVFPNGKPATEDSMVSRIKAIAQDIEKKYTKYSSSIISAPKDGVFNYSRQLLSMGLLARNFMDAWKEGDGTRTMRMWKFLFLHFKQNGNTKYAVEAFRLLAKVNITATPRQRHELIWNRYVSTRNGRGHNRPVDLQMEFFNRVFKEDLKSFHSHLTPAIVKRTANAAAHVDHILSEQDSFLQVRYESGLHSSSDKSKDIALIAQTLTNAEVFAPRAAARCHSQFRAIPQEMFSGVIDKLSTLERWLKTKITEFAQEVEYTQYKNSLSM